jgi:hypothetical protein
MILAAEKPQVLHPAAFLHGRPYIPGREKADASE